MRLIVFVFIIFLAGMIGMELKRKYDEQRNFLIYLKCFLEYLALNISIYKTNLNEIIINYLIQQNNKNAKYDKIFCKNNNLYQINKEIIGRYVYEKDLKALLELYFSNIGKSDIQSESLKLKSIKLTIDNGILKTSDEIKLNGNLLFKICIALGVVIVIILWWLYEYFYFI